MEFCSIPNHFLDDHVISILDGSISFSEKTYYKPTLGLLMKLRKSVKRLVKRNFKRAPPNDFYGDQIQKLWLHFCFPANVGSDDQCAEHISALDWTPAELNAASIEILRKSSSLSPALMVSLDDEPLFPPFHANNDTTPSGNISLGTPVPPDSIVVFRDEFVEKVVAYHSSVSRPDGTFALPSEGGAPAAATVCSDVNGSDNRGGIIPKMTGAHQQLVEELCELPRVPCPVCMARKQLYCGHCKGVRMSNATSLPTRVSLPFDLLLIVHWCESTHKCTGVHARAMCEVGDVDIVPWNKEQYHALVESLDPQRDIILYPNEQAVLPSALHDILTERLKSSGTNGVGGCGRNGRYRLVVLEASWQHGATMARQLQEHRQSLSLPPIIFLTLPKEALVGQYWKFQEVGQSAVSTIEAVAFAAKVFPRVPRACPAATTTATNSATSLDCVSTDFGDEQYNHLLTLFHVQRQRVLMNTIGLLDTQKKVTQCESTSSSHKGNEHDSSSGDIGERIFKKKKILDERFHPEPKAAKEGLVKIPRAMCVVGYGAGCWTNVLVRSKCQ